MTKCDIKNISVIDKSVTTTFNLNYDRNSIVCKTPIGMKKFREWKSIDQCLHLKSIQCCVPVLKNRNL